MPDSYMTASPPPVLSPDGPTLSEITLQLHRRVAWYGLDGLVLRTVERRDDGHVVAHLGDAAARVYREVIDGWTGQVRERGVIWRETAARAA